MEAPSFLHFHYFHQIKEYLEHELLPEFHKQYNMPKEDEWKSFLGLYVPRYKVSGKDC